MALRLTLAGAPYSSNCGQQTASTATSATWTFVDANVGNYPHGDRPDVFVTLTNGDTVSDYVYDRPAGRRTSLAAQRPPLLREQGRSCQLLRHQRHQSTWATSATVAQSATK